eukprot:jgi/Psemu1/10181/gm1.10181_g
MMIPISKRRRTVAAASRVVMAVMFPTAGVLVLAAVVASSVSAFSGPWNGRSSYCKGNRFLPLHHYKNNKNHRLHLYLHRPNNIGCSCSGSGSGSRHRYRYNNNNNNECSIPHRQRSWLSLFYAPSNSAEVNNAGFFGSNNNNNNDDDDDNSINNSNDIINSNLAFFCLELGCTIPEFRAAVNEFKRRKITLSGERLEVEDEIASLLEAEAAESGGFLKNTLGSAFSSLWSLTTTDEDNDKDINSNSNTNYDKNYYKNGRDTGRNNKSKQSSPRSETTSASTTRGEEVTILEEERKELSERALAIQNLMANLQWLEDTGVGSSSSTSSNTSGTQGPSLSPSATTTTATTTAIKELANRYRSIARTEGIKIRASTATATTESETQSYFYATGYGDNDNDNESDDDNDESEGPASANNYKDTYTEGLEDDDFDDDFDDEYEELTDLDADRNDAQSKNDPEAPHPPYIPPTDLQFMSMQIVCRVDDDSRSNHFRRRLSNHLTVHPSILVATSDSAARIGEGDSQTDDDDDDEDNAMTRIANWFGKDRIDTNPFQK